MTLFVADAAKPYNVQWLVIIFMMRFSLFFSASFARLAKKFALKYCSPDGVVSNLPARIFFSPGFCNSCPKRTTMSKFCSFPVVLSYVFNIFFPM